MSQKEISRLEAMGFLKSKKITQVEAANLLGITIRQVKRLWKKYKLFGARGLVSKKRGRPSNNRISGEVRQRALSLIKEHYFDFGPTFANEKLVEIHGVEVSKETLRKWMMSEAIWKAKRRKKVRIHQLRERRSCEGELVQIDGSPHAWFGEDHEKCTLLVFVDDATSKIMHLRFETAETTAGYFKGTRAYIEQHGVPLAFYSDRHSIFRINTPETVHDGQTQFGRAMGELGIELICANSPQAKGRVERLNGVLQDRLTKELRLQGISDISVANEWLPKFIEDYNRRFAVMPKREANMHRMLCKSADELNVLFSYQSDRRLSKNLEISYDNTVYQIQVAGIGYTLRHARITVCEDLTGNITLLYKDRKLAFRCYKKQKNIAGIVCAKELNQKVNLLTKQMSKPKPDHPWRQYKEPLRAYGTANR